MKKKWMRIVAIVLAMCLFMNSQIWEMPMQVYAVEGETTPTVSPTVQQAETLSEEDEEENEEENEDGETEETPAATVLETPATTPESENGSGDETATPSTAPSATPTGTEGQQEENAPTPSATVAAEAGTASATPTATAEASATPTMTPSATPTMTPEMEDQYGIALLSDDAGSGQYTLPETVADYITVRNTGTTTFYIKEDADFLRVQEFCKDASVDGFENITFVIAPTAAGTWDIGSIDGFDGIGTADHPFKGEIYCHFAIGAGAKFKLSEPMFSYLGEGANVHQLDLVSNDSCSAIAENISGNVTISNICVAGRIGGGSGTAGTIAANITAGTVTLSDFTSTANVTGATAGGVAGTIADGAAVDFGDNVAIGSSDSKITVTGTTAAGSFFGVVTGSQTWDLTSPVYAGVVGNDNSCYSGQFAGKVINRETVVETFTISDGNSVTVDISGTGHSGGFFGLCEGKWEIEKPDGTFTVAGSINGSDSGYTGGIVGVLKGAEIELTDYQIDASLSNRWTGGVAGSLNGGKYIMGDITVNGSVWGRDIVGGVAGSVTSAALELQGNITIAKTPTGSIKKGYVAGTQGSSLIYFSEIQGKIGEQKQLSVPDSSLEEIYIDYGGVFRNQDLGNGKKLIGDGTLSQVGVVNNTVNKSGDDYQLTSEADFVSLAIVLWTESNFGTSAFPGADAAALLKASYTVTNNVDISYETTGIISLNRNGVGETYAFSGKMQGINDSITITQNSSVKQNRVGVFSTLTGDAEFSYLTINGKVENAIGTGGLAYRTIGTSLKLSHIKMEKEFTNNTEDIGGVLAKESSSSSKFILNADHLTLASTIEAGDNNAYSGFVTSVDKAVVSMDNVILGGKLSSDICITNGRTTVGGFLGKAWTNTGGTIENVTVQEGTIYEAKEIFGGLFERVTTDPAGERLILKNVVLDHLTVNANSEANNCALLVYNAEVLVLEVINYDSTGCVVNNPGNYFDEVAGSTRGWSDLGPSGIVSLHKTDESGNPVYFPEYHYENKVESLKGRNNRCTMYFYDVFQCLENADGSVNTTNQIGTDHVLDTNAKVLLWDVTHYAKAGFRNYFSKYYAEGTVPDIAKESYTFKGNLDLSTISFYPVSNVTDGTYTGQDAVITFGVDMGEWTLSNETGTSQHYALQAGLFVDPVKLSVSDITLSGQVAKLGDRSGALIMGQYGLTGGGSFENITLKDLWVADYVGSSQDAPCGLLISKIADVTASFEGIEMTGYSAKTGQKAGAALIYSAGGADAKNLVLDFHNMKIADEKDGGSVEHNGNYLSHASFLYNYNYTDDASINKGHGLYLFSEADDTSGNVTYGYELDADTEYSDNSNKVFEGEAANYNENFIPYVFQTKKIEVNPKSGDILKGCGTYEDPYIIESEKQFLTLYRYINETGTEGNYQYQSFYEGWKLIAPGDDSSFCTVKHAVEVGTDGTLTGTGADDVKTFGTSTDFPTPDEMSRAYYQLGADIDLTKEMSTTYEKIAEDFVGFGTLERPFVGVWYGKDTAGTVHTVTLPNKKNSQSYETYGFIQYAKGAVVKDIKISTSKTNWSDGTSKAANVKTMGGSVIACILGGDNIIDNVTVDTKLIVADANAAIGGYVGNVKKGGLILRNVSGTALKEFEFDATITPAFPGAVVGKVEDGYVLYEGNSTEVSNYLWTGKVGNTAYSAVSNYSILYGEKLKSDVSGLQVNLTATDANNPAITITIPNAAALQVMSMALNSDSLNVRPSTDANYKETGANYSICGYTELSRSRKADYSSIGNCADASDSDYIKAASYDNVMGYVINGDGGDAANKAYAYPYMYQYMGITGDAYLTYLETPASGGYSVLNPAGVINSKCYHIYWELVENGSYDMSQANFGKAFRGIGALYARGSKETDGYGGVFHGSFDGKERKITLEMNREILGSDGEIVTVKNVGLFNTLYGSYGTDTIQGLYNETADFGEEEPAIKPCFMIENIVLAGSINCTTSNQKSYAGGVVATVSKGNYCFSNIAVDSDNSLKIGNAESKADGIASFGGIAGYIKGSTYVLIQDSDFAGTESKKIELQGNNSGGGFTGDLTGNLKIKDSSVEYLELKSSNGHAGGLIGCGIGGSTIICVGEETGKVSVKNSNMVGINAGGIVGMTEPLSQVSLTYVNSEANTIKASGYRNCDGGIIGYAQSIVLAQNIVCDSCIIGTGNTLNSGGMIGQADNDLLLFGVQCQNVTVNAYKCAGGIVGETVYDKASYIGNVEVTNLTIQEGATATNTLKAGLGGVVGRNAHSLTIDNAEVQGTLTDGKYNFQIKSYTDKARTGSAAAGGILGYHGGGNIVTLTDCTVDSISVEMDINSSSTTNLSAGGLVGYTGSKVELSGDVSTNNLSVTVPMAADVGAEAVAAGGCFGLVSESGNVTGINPAGVASTYYQGLTATNNVVKGKQAGGIIGNVLSSGTTNIRLQEITVSDGQVLSDETAGGVFGYMKPSSDGGAALDSLRQTVRNTISNMQISGRKAGGVIGELDHYGPIRIENIDVTECSIIGVQPDVSTSAYSAGGVVGQCCATKNSQRKYSFYFYGGKIENNTIACEVQGDTLLETEDKMEKNKQAVGGIIGRLWTQSGSAPNNTAQIFCDNVTLANNNQIGIRKKDTTETKLIKISTYELASASLPAEGEVSSDYEALEKLVQEYGYYVGSIVGVVQGNPTPNIQFYMLRSDETDFVTPVMGNNPPVTDVGRLAGVDMNTYREYCHIIYGAKNPDASDVEKNLADMKAEVEKAESAYEGTDTIESLLSEYRLDQETIELFNKTYYDAGGYTFPGTDTAIEFPILVWKAENGTLQEVMENIVDVMTNVAGASASDIYDEHLQIKCTQKLCAGTNVTDGTGTASITATYNNSEYLYTSEQYDNINEDGSFTYTEVEFTYCRSKSGTDHSKKFVIRIFVEEPILYSVHAKIMEGRVTDVDTIREKGISETASQIMMANDSDYTMLLEYSYGKARKQMGDAAVDKVFYLQSSEEGVLEPIKKGTKLLLVDVTHGNKAYYYTVESDDVTEIKFTDFKDSAGDSYVNQPISALPDETDGENIDFYTDLEGHTLTETGVERYLLTVLHNENSEDEEKSDRLYSIHTGLLIEDEDLASKFKVEEDHEEEASFPITVIPGLTITLNTENSNTDIGGIEEGTVGTISKEGGVTVKATIELSALDIYWAYREGTADTPMIDSSNNGKYLELAFYLRDKNGNRVKLPSGTNFSYLNVKDGTYSENKVIPDDSLIYYYKDIGSMFEDTSSEYKISDITGNTSVPIEFKLNFQGADLSGITEESYTAWIDLLRTANADYPMGSGNKMASYDEPVNASAMQQLGFAVRANELSELAINTYPVAAETNEINYQVMFDFSDILATTSGAGKEQVLTKWANYDYEVTYQIYKKTDNSSTVTYEAYTGSDIAISATEGVTSSTGAGSATLTAVYNFAENDIAGGNGESAVAGILSFPCKITISTNNLTATELQNLTNYKLEAKLVIREKGTTGSSSTTDKETKDFFIYTITKLKTDL